MLNPLVLQIGSYSLLDWLTGLFGVVCAVAFFGTFAIPIKCAPLNTSGLHPAYLQLYKSLGVCMTSVPLTMILGGTDVIYDAVFDTHTLIAGLLGSIMWVVSGLLMIICIRTAGIGISFAILTVVAQVVSFCWGYFVFGDPVRSLLVTNFALN